MPSKLKKAIGAVKDQTSISLAKVSNNNSSANLEVTVLKATSHDVVPIVDKYIQEILTLITSNKSYASSCAQAIAKRIGKTRNWIVVLKSLMLVLRIFQDGDPYFPIEVLHAMKGGAKILNLSNFRDDSNSCPWDYTAFVRTFALYLEERLDCFLTGKLQRRFTYQRDQEFNNNRRGSRSNEPVIRDMKPAILLDRIHYWQKLLDRAIATTPTGAAKTNRLVLISLYSIVQETYDLYRDISDGLALLLDSFFQLQYQSCVTAFQACVKASEQFEKLASFYRPQWNQNSAPRQFNTGRMTTRSADAGSPTSLRRREGTSPPWDGSSGMQTSSRRPSCATSLPSKKSLLAPTAMQTAPTSTCPCLLPHKAAPATARPLPAPPMSTLLAQLSCK